MIISGVTRPVGVCKSQCTRQFSTRDTATRGLGSGDDNGDFEDHDDDDDIYDHDDHDDKDDIEDIDDYDVDDDDDK